MGGPSGGLMVRQKSVMGDKGVRMAWALIPTEPLFYQLECGKEPLFEHFHLCLISPKTELNSSTCLVYLLIVECSILSCIPWSTFYLSLIQNWAWT